MSLEDAFEQKLAKNDNPVQNKAKGAKNEAIEALVALGYSSSEALKALNGIEITDDTDVEDILKAALKNMAFMSVSYTHLDVYKRQVIVPGSVFGRDGSRYGYGKGYYDRFFAKNPKLKRYAVCYACLLYTSRCV